MLNGTELKALCFFPHFFSLFFGVFPECFVFSSLPRRAKVWKPARQSWQQRTWRQPSQRHRSSMNWLIQKKRKKQMNNQFQSSTLQKTLRSNSLIDDHDFVEASTPLWRAAFDHAWTTIQEKEKKSANQCKECPR